MWKKKETQEEEKRIWLSDLDYEVREENIIFEDKGIVWKHFGLIVAWFILVGVVLPSWIAVTFRDTVLVGILSILVCTPSGTIPFANAVVKIDNEEKGFWYAKQPILILTTAKQLGKVRADNPDIPVFAGAELFLRKRSLLDLPPAYDPLIRTIISQNHWFVFPFDLIRLNDEVSIPEKDFLSGKFLKDPGNYTLYRFTFERIYTNKTCLLVRKYPEQTLDTDLGMVSDGLFSFFAKTAMFSFQPVNCGISASGTIAWLF